MAVTITIAELRNAVRTEASTEEDQILTRLLSVGTALVEMAAPDAPDPIQNEATVRVAAYLYDQPPSARSNGTSNAPAEQRRGGLVAPLADAPGRQHGTEREFRHDHDRRRRGRARYGRGARTCRAVEPARQFRSNPAREADECQRGRDRPDRARRGGGRTDGRRPSADHGGREDRRGSRLNWALRDHPGTRIPGWKLPPTEGVSSIHEGARLQAPPRAMRIGWNQSPTFSASVFTRANDHPVDGAALGMTSPGLAVPPAPPALDTDATLYLGIWVAGDIEVDGTRILHGDTDLTDTFRTTAALTVGAAGYVYVSKQRLAHTTSRTLAVLIPGDFILGASDVAGWALSDDDTPIPADKLVNSPAGGGGATLTELATVAAASSTTTSTYRRWQAFVNDTDLSSHTYLRVHIDIGGIEVWSPDFRVPDPLASTTFTWCAWGNDATINRLSCQLASFPGATTLFRIDAYPVDTSSTTAVGGPSAETTLYGVS